jgi:ArsR family transcriptional regulator
MSTRRTTPTFEALFSALADRTRLRLLNLMRDGEVCVCHFVEILEINQPKVSRHLAYLRRAGVVEARREGKWVYYRIVVPGEGGGGRIVEEVLGSFDGDGEMQRDRKRLRRLC